MKQPDLADVSRWFETGKALGYEYMFVTHDNFGFAFSPHYTTEAGFAAEEAKIRSNSFLDLCGVYALGRDQAAQLAISRPYQTPPSHPIGEGHDLLLQQLADLQRKLATAGLHLVKDFTEASQVFEDQTPIGQAYKDAAGEHMEDGAWELHSRAIVSFSEADPPDETDLDDSVVTDTAGNAGAYVLCWRYVDASELPEEFQDRQDDGISPGDEPTMSDVEEVFD